MFRIKICGVTNVPDAVTAADAGADAIGLNFYERSSRYLDPELAAQIGSVIAPTTTKIGVFVNHAPSHVDYVSHRAALDGVQIHGDESPADFARIVETHMPQLGKHTQQVLEQLVIEPESDSRSTMLGLIAGQNRPKVIRARRLGDEGVCAIAADLQACLEAGAWPAAILIDAMTPGRYGGTGETVSWVGLADHNKWLGDTPLILAGGLTPDNVAEAIRIVRPNGVDVASGVESAPGKKDPHKVRDFIAAARSAFDSL
jgi:phosphoribosylanthranilate isomerase